MQFIVYDFEVLEYDWIVVFKKDSEITVIHNDATLLENYFLENCKNIFVGFNNKHYDDYIFKGIISDLNPKRISDFIIKKDKQGWEYPGIKYLPLISLDLKQDIIGGIGLSLKEIEGNLGLNIKESDIDFNFSSKLTREQLNKLIEYCKYDVLTTEQILIERKNDIFTRLELLKLFKLPIKYIGLTNAKLTAIILDAKRQEWDDEYNYTFPDTLDIKNTTIIDFYKQELNYNNILTSEICGVIHTFGYGGLHGAKKGVFEGNIWYIDVKSYYPTLIVKYNYLSRNVKNPKKYEEMYNLRLSMIGINDNLADLLKLVLNTAYGAMKNKYNQLYDPKQPNQICISGQLFLVDLLEKIEPYITLIQSNTDGIIFISHDDEKCTEIIQEWQNRTKLHAPINKIDKIWQKDVNNYIFKIKDKIKVKGAIVKEYLGGSFKKKTATCIHTAVVNYFVNNIPVEKSIYNNNNLIEYQYICKKGPTYDYIEHNGKKVNNCNRVFASKNEKNGKLYKVKLSINRKDSIAYLPDKCIIVNDELSNTNFIIKDIDKEWYINEANKKIQQFIKR